MSNATSKAVRKSLTEAQSRVLSNAIKREHGFVCPTPGIYAAAQDALLKSLRSKGYVINDPSPIITEAGREAIREFNRQKVIADWESKRATRTGWCHAGIDCERLRGVGCADQTRCPQWEWDR